MITTYHPPDPLLPKSAFQSLKVIIAKNEPRPKTPKLVRDLMAWFKRRAA